MAKPLSTQLDRGFFLEIFIKTLSLSSPFQSSLGFGFIKVSLGNLLYNYIVNAAFQRILHGHPLFFL